MTFAEFERLPDMPGTRELVDGGLITTPPRQIREAEASKRIFSLLVDSLGLRRAWLPGAGYRIGGGWVEPNVSVSWPDQKQDEKYFVGSPMIAVEILSPGEEIERKLTLYFAEGALEVWVIDPRHQSMTVYALSLIHI